MPEIRSTLELDSSSALSTVDEIGSALDGMVSNFASQFSDAVSGSSIAVDTSGADSAVQALGTDSAAAADQVTGLKDSAKGLEGAALLATGQLGGMRTVVQGFGADAVPAVAGVLALVGGIGTLIHSGIQATGEMQRFHTALGDLAGRASTINVGTLNEDLGKLANSLGSDDEALFGASASLFQFGTNAGLTRQSAERLSEQVIALSARAVALNPALGSVADVAQSAIRAFSSGRDRALIPFQLGLNKNEIAARALSIAMADGRTEVEGYDRAQAVATLGAEKFGGALKNDITKGTQNAIIQQRSLKEEVQNFIETAGKPLVVPFFELFRAALPAVGALAGVLSTLAVGVLPSVTTAVSAVTPALTALSAVIEILGPIIPAVVDGFIAFEAVSFLPSLLLGIGIAFEALGANAVAAGAEVAAASIEMSATPIGLIAAALAAAAAAFGLFGGSASDAATDVTKFSTQSDTALRKMAEALAVLGRGDSFIDSHAAAMKQLKDISEQNIGTAQRWGAALVDAGVVKQGEVTRLLKDGTAAQRQSKADTEANTAAIQAQGTATTTLAQQVSDLAGTINAQVPTAAGQFSSFSQAVSSAFGGAIPSVQGFVDNLNSTVQGVASWLTNVQGLLNQNLPGLAQLVESQGAVIGGKLAIEIQNATPATRIAWEQQIEQGTFALTTGKTTAGTLAQQTAQAIIGNFSGVGAGVAAQVAQVPGAINAAAPGSVNAAAGLGTGVSSQFGAGVAPIPGLAGTAVSGAGGSIASAGAAVNEQARSAGYGVGLLFTRGIAEGVSSGSGSLNSTVTSVVNSAVAAAKAAAGIKSPSQVAHDEVGLPIARGIAAGMMTGAFDVVAAAEHLTRVAVAAPPKTAFPSVASGAGAGAGSAAGGGVGGVKVIVVRDLWEARDHLPAGVANDPAFLGGR